MEENAITFEIGKKIRNRNFRKKMSHMSATERDKDWYWSEKWQDEEIEVDEELAMVKLQSLSAWRTL